MPGLNNTQSLQATYESQGIRVTQRFADDSTSGPNVTNSADDSTSGLNLINSADDSTSGSPTVVPIGRGERLTRPINTVNPSSGNHRVGRGGRVLPPSRLEVDDSTSSWLGRNTANNLFVGRGVGRGQPTRSNTEPSTSAPRVGREVGGGAGRGGRYFHPYQRPANQTSASTRNETRSSSVIILDSEGEEVEEEEESFVRSNDDHHRSTCIEHLFSRRRTIFSINERYLESFIQQQVRVLEHENIFLRAEVRRLNVQICRLMDLLIS